MWTWVYISVVERFSCPSISLSWIHQRSRRMPKLMSRKPQAVKTGFFERGFNDLLNALTAYPCLTAAYKERVTVNNAVLRPNGEIRRDSLHAGVLLPLPSTTRVFSSVIREIFMPTSSDKRRPQLRKSVRMQ